MRFYQTVKFSNIGTQLSQTEKQRSLQYAQGVHRAEDSEYYLTKAKEMGFKLKIHADEMYPLGGAQLAARVGAVSADHLLKASEEGIRQMKEAGVISTLLPATALDRKSVV